MFIPTLIALLAYFVTAHDMICKPPPADQCLPKEQWRHLLPLPWKDVGTIIATGTVHVNVNTDPSAPPTFVQVGTIAGKNYQFYNVSTCTIDGLFYLEVAPGVFVLASTWSFRLLFDSVNNHFVSYCLTDPENTGQYIIGSTSSVDFYQDAFLANKGYNGTQNGNLVQFETFKFYNDTFSQYELTQYSTISSIGPTVKIFFAYNRTSTTVPELESHVWRTPSKFNEKYHRAGHVLIPQSKIAKQYQKYFNFV